MNSNTMRENQVTPVTNTVEQLCERVDSKKLFLPIFQRGIVWTDKDRRLLIESVLRGFPVGSLLIQKRTELRDGEGNEYETDLLIDGLQRTNALRQFLNDPLQWEFSHEILNGDHLVPLRESIKDLWGISVEIKEITRCLDEFLKSLDGLRDPRLNPVDLIRHTIAILHKGHPDDIPEEYGINAVGELNPHFTEIITKVITTLDISNVNIPVLEYVGSGDDLSEIFSRLNKEGTKLSRYDLLAAYWYSDFVSKPNEKIVSNVKKKYEALKSKGFLFENYDEDGELDDLTLYEYLLGLGKVLIEKGPFLFSDSGDAAQVLTNAFTITTVAHGLSLPELKSLPEVLPRNTKDNNKISLSAFEEALISSVIWVNDIVFGSLGGFQLNNHKGKRINSGKEKLPHADSLINSIIIGVLLERFDPKDEWAERSTWKNKSKTLIKPIQRLYVQDIASSYWTGPLETLLLDRVWNGFDGKLPKEERLAKLAPRGLGEPAVTADSLNRALDDYCLKTLDVKHERRQPVKEEDEIILRIVYGDELSAHDEKSSEWQIDHTVPIDFLKRSHLEKTKPNKWPINHVANLALMKGTLNNSKRAKTIFEFIDELRSQDKKREMKSCQQSLLSDPALLQKEIGEVLWSEDFDEKIYTNYLLMRFDDLRLRVLIHLELISEDGP
jgi:hypothetical protein